MNGGRYASMDGGGRATQDDSMDGIGRVVSGTKTEQLPSGTFADYHFYVLPKLTHPTHQFISLLYILHGIISQ